METEFGERDIGRDRDREKWRGGMSVNECECWI